MNVGSQAADLSEPAADREGDHASPFRPVTGCSRLASPFAQDEFLDLAGGRLRQRHQRHMPRRLEVRQALATPADQLFAGDIPLGLGTQGDEGMRGFAPARIGPRHHGGLEHLRMLVEHLLDLQRTDVLAAGNDDVLGPVLDLHIAIRVQHGQVAGVQPAASQGAAGGFGVVQVAFHHRVAAHHQLAQRRPVGGHRLAGFAIQDRGVLEHRMGHALAAHEPRASLQRQLVDAWLPQAQGTRAIAFGHAIGMGDAETARLHGGDHRAGRCGATGDHRHRLGRRGACRSMDQHRHHHRRGAQVRRQVGALGLGIIDAHQQRWRVQHRQRLVDHRAELAIAQQYPGRAMAQDEGDAARLQADIDAHQHGTRAGHAIVRLEHLGDVRRQDRHTLARLHADPLQGAGQGPAALVQLLAAAQVAAIDHDLAAAHAAAGVTGEQQQGAVQVRRLAVAPARNTRTQSLPRVTGQERLVQVGHHVSRRQGVHANAMARQLQGHGAGQVRQAGLGRQIRGDGAGHPAGEDRGDVDQAAALPCGNHAPRAFLGHRPGALEVGVEYAVPTAIIAVEQRLAVAHAGVVDQHIQGAGGIEHPADIVPAGHIEGKGAGPAAAGLDGLDQGLQRRLAPGGDQHLGAGGRQGLGKVPAQATGGPVAAASVTSRALVEEFLRQAHAVHFARTVIDAERPDIAEDPLHHRVPGHPAPAQHLHRAINHPPQRLGADHLGHARVDIAPLALVEYPGAVPYRQAHHMQVHLVVGEHEADTLVLAQRFAEGVAGARMIAGDVVGTTRGAEPAHAVGQPCRRQTHLGVAEALADLAEHIARRDAQVVETQLPVATGEAAVQRVQLPFVDDALTPHVAEEHGRRAVLHARHDDREIGAVSAGDQPLAAVDQVIVAIAGGRGAQHRRIRA
ncbi:hypothetical protein WR25_02371 [Diploscapter pachys]|uniref:Uncharacterized protein n=1 Tax=Diploscapter pachys TaxID=2018661 RepID=A0A2A2JZN9_9BILA|nr:hypothetical protein WR25_02371 [Diploscapter pachys]